MPIRRSRGNRNRSRSRSRSRSTSPNLDRQRRLVRRSIFRSRGQISRTSRQNTINILSAAQAASPTQRLSRSPRRSASRNA
jgi:hypothetical protein